MAKKGADKGKKKGKKPAGGGSNWPTISVATHPRAANSIRRTKAWAALATLMLVTFLSHEAGLTAFDATIRGLLTAVGVYFFVWALSVVFWRWMIVHEAKTEAERRRDQRMAQMQQLMEAQSGRGDA